MKLPRIWDFLCHADIVLGSIFVVLFWLDRANPAMEFINSDISKGLLLFFCLCAIANGVTGAVYLFKKEKGHAVSKTAHDQESSRYEKRY